MSNQTTRIMLRLPADARDFIAAQAERNTSSMNSEIVRCIRDRMEMNAATGIKFGDPGPAAAGESNPRGEAFNGER